MEKPRELTWMDGARGLLALWVLLGHAAADSGVNIPLISSPAKAVDCFMLISGFLMMHHYRLRETAEPWNRGSTVVAFWVRRFFRIAPLYYSVLLIAYLVDALRRDWMGLTASAQVGGSLVETFLIHATFAFGLFPSWSQSTPMVPDWSLGLEMQFYAIFPLWAPALRKMGIGRMLFLTLAVWLLAHSLWGVYSIGEIKAFGRFPQPSFLPLKAPHFLLGMCMAKMWHDDALSETRMAQFLLLHTAASLWRVPLSAIAVVCVAGSLQISSLRTAGKSALCGLGCMLARALSTPLARRSGDLSFGIYLLHMLWLSVFEEGVALLTGWKMQPGFVRFALCSFLVGATSVLTSAGLHRSVELPMIAVGRRVARRLSAR